MGCTVFGSIRCGGRPLLHQICHGRRSAGVTIPTHPRIWVRGSYQVYVTFSAVELATIKFPWPTQQEFLKQLRLRYQEEMARFRATSVISERIHIWVQMHPCKHVCSDSGLFAQVLDLGLQSLFIKVSLTSQFVRRTALQKPGKPQCVREICATSYIIRIGT